MDSDRDVSPFVTDKAGKPLAKNPLKDPRVRKAISKAINRPAMVEKVMEGEAVPAGQLVPEFLFGATKNLKVEAYDPEGAKKLLAEAGYPDGFGLTIHAPNNRYVNDAKVAQAVAQMLSRVGIDTKVVAMPSATYFTQATDLKFSFMLLGWSTGTGEASSSLKALLMTFNRDKGYGTANRGRYSNGKVDALTEDALATVDDAKREALLQRATELAINDTGDRPAALPGQPVGDARRHHLRAAHRREHARLEVPPGRSEVTGSPRDAAAMNAPEPLSPITTPAAHFIGNRWVAAATGATLPMIDPSDGKPFAAIASRQRARHRSGGAGGASGRATAPGDASPRRRRAGCSSRLGARDPRSRRRARADRGARLRQAAAPGARRRRGVRPLLRVLRRRLATSSRARRFRIRPATRC